MTLPANTYSPEGWFSMPLYSDATGLSAFSSNLLNVRGDASGNNIYAYQNGTSLRLYVDNVLKETTTALDLFEQWNYFSLKYTMTGSDWGGQIYVNGSPVTSFHQDSRGAEVGGSLSFASRAQGDRVNYFGQIILHDSMADSGETIKAM